MRYPVKIEGAISADGNELELLPPSGIVQEAARMLAPKSRILDVGAYNGTNGFYLADLGHSVDSIEVNPQYVYDASQLARLIGGAAINNRFTIADFEDIIPKSDYDAAIATRVLPYMHPVVAYKSLRKLQESVRPGGLNVVSVFLGEPRDRAIFPNLTLFNKWELKAIYEGAGWETATYREEDRPVEWKRHPRTGAEMPHASSFAELIAKKPS